MRPSSFVPLNLLIKQRAWTFDCMISALHLSISKTADIGRAKMLVKLYQAATFLSDNFV